MLDPSATRRLRSIVSDNDGCTGNYSRPKLDKKKGGGEENVESVRLDPDRPRLRRRKKLLVLAWQVRVWHLILRYNFTDDDHMYPRSTADMNTRTTPKCREWIHSQLNLNERL